MSTDESFSLNIRVPRSCGANKVYYEECFWDRYTDLRFNCKRVTGCKCITNFFEKNGDCLSNGTNRAVRLNSHDFNHYLRNYCK